MSEIQTYPIGKDEAEKASPFLSQEAEKALLKGLPVTALAAVLDGNAIGALAGAIDGYVFEIWSIYVDPEHRRKGAGRALIGALEKLLEGSEGVMTTAAGMPIRARYTAVSKDNETLLPFFLGMGFNGDPIPHPMYYMGYLDDIKSRNKLSARMFQSSDEILPFSRTSERILKLTSNQSIQQGFPVPEGGLLSDRVDRDLSFCTIHGDKIKAYVTAEDRGDNMVEISSLWSGIDNPVVLLAMLIKVIDALRERYSPDTRIAMLSTNERADKLIEYVFRHVEQCSYRMVKI